MTSPSSAASTNHDVGHPALPLPPLPGSEQARPDWVNRIVTLLVLAALLVPPALFGDDRYWLPLFTKYVALAIFALGVDLVWGYTGMLSLGQGLYFGLGAYCVGYSLKLQKSAEQAGAPVGSIVLPDFMAYCRLEAVPAWIAPLNNVYLALALAVIVPVVVAALFGMVMFRLRIRGVYFSLITQALVLAAFTLVVNQQPYTGGVVGMTYLAKLTLFGHTFSNILELYFLLLGVLLVAYLGCVWLMASKFGKVLTAIRDNENRVLALGYDTARYKALVFAIAGGLSGLAGALYVATNGTAGPEYLGIAFSIEAVILVAVGGRGTLIGAILGTMLVRLGNTYINEISPKYWPIILGSLFIGVVVFMPEGIVGWLRAFPNRWQRWLGRKPVTAS